MGARASFFQATTNRKTAMTAQSAMTTTPTTLPPLQDRGRLGKEEDKGVNYGSHYRVPRRRNTVQPIHTRAMPT